MENPPKKYFRMAIGQEVRLRYAYIVKCTSIEKDAEASELVKKSSWSEAEEVYNLKLVLHFYHELVFKPSASSKLTVKYDIDTLSRSYKGSKYNFIYDISTGGTWKGNINDFIVLTDSSMTAHNSNANFEVEKIYEPLVFYITQNYKPQKNEFFEFKFWKYFSNSISEK